MRAPRATKRRLSRNAALAGLRFAVSAVLALLVTPYALEILGAEQFGIWAIAGGVLVAVRLLDLGVRGALVREVASSEGDDARAMLAASLTMALVTGIAAVLVVAALAVPALAFLRIPSDLQSLALIALVGTAGVGAIENAFAPHAAALEGAGRTDISSSIDTLQRIASASAVVGVLALGWGLPGLVLKNAALAFAAGFSYRAALGRTVPTLARTRAMRDWPRARSLLRFGRHVQTVNLSALVIDPLGKVFLGRFAGLEAVSTYELASLVAGQAAGAFMAVAQIVYPESARARFESDPVARRAALMGLWRSTERAIAVPAAGAFPILAALAVPFVAEWLGAGHEAVAPAIAVLCVGWVVAIAALPAGLVAQGGGAEKVATRGALMTSAVGVVGALVFAAPAGVIGVAAARSAGLVLGGASAWIELARLWTRPRPNRGAAAGPLVCGVLAAAAAGVMATAVAGGALGVVLVGAVSFAGYLTLVTAAGWMPLVPAGRSHRPRAVAPVERNPKLRTTAGPPRRLRTTAGPPRRLRPVAAVIPAWNAADRIVAVLNAVLPQVDLVVLVDNGSRDGTSDLAESQAADRAESVGADLVVIRRAANDGYAAALNEGMARVLERGAGSVLWLNDDVILEEGAVEAMVAVLTARSDAAAASARLVYQDRPGVLNGAGGTWRADRSWAALRGEGEPDVGQYDHAPDPDYPSGAASLVASDAWSDVGPMDQSWFLYFEDVDWGLRAARRGWRTAFAPLARARHAGSLGTRADPARRRYYNVRNRLRFANRYATVAGRIWVWAATTVLLAKQAVRLLFPTRRRDAEAVVAAVADHLRGRSGRSSRFG